MSINHATRQQNSNTLFVIHYNFKILKFLNFFVYFLKKLNKNTKMQLHKRRYTKNKRKKQMKLKEKSCTCRWYLFHFIVQYNGPSYRLEMLSTLEHSAATETVTVSAKKNEKTKKRGILASFFFCVIKNNTKWIVIEEEQKTSSNILWQDVIHTYKITQQYF